MQLIKTTILVFLMLSANRVWQVMADYGNIKNYHPLVEASPLLSQNPQGLGATRQCEFYDKTNLVEEVIDWQDGHSYTVKLSDSNMPLKNATATMSIQATSDNTSIVTIEMNYTVKYGPVGWVMGILMMRPMMQRMFRKVLTALQHHALTGEIIGKNG